MPSRASRLARGEGEEISGHRAGACARDVRRLTPEEQGAVLAREADLELARALACAHERNPDVDAVHALGARRIGRENADADARARGRAAVRRVARPDRSDPAEGHQADLARVDQPPPG